MRWLMTGFDEKEKVVRSLEDLGKQIRSRRKELGYTQCEVAEFNQCSPRFVGDLERGKAGANLKQVLEIANSLGIDIMLRNRG